MAEPMIDLRSDTVTRPSAGMRDAMARAEVGDDVYGDDPTMNRLLSRVAELFECEAAIFLPSGTQSNLVALMSHCQRGDEVLVGLEAHTYRYEAGGAAVLGSIQQQPIANQPDGSLALEDIEAAIKPDDPHFAQARLLTLENTIGGKVLSRTYLESALALAKRRGLATHLDGARIFNAAVKLGMPVGALCRGFDSASVCLSKGLGTPAGSVLVGSRELINRAVRNRKMLGGAMRQAGILAAAGLYALDHNIERLAQDHAHAERLAAGLASVGWVKVRPVQTNMVFVDIPAERVALLSAYLSERHIIASLGAHSRFVTHLDVDRAGIDRVIEAFRSFPLNG
jgi:threonine aldolase